MKRDVLLIFCGVAGALTALWGGAWLYHLCGDTWREFPAVLTAIFLFMASVGIGVAGAVNLSDRP